MKNLCTIAAFCCATAVLCGCSEHAGQPGPSAHVSVLDETSFDAAVAEGVVLVDFWAPWCGPCRTQGPIVEEVANEVKSFAKVAKLNTDDAPKIAQRYGIRSIPTLIVFKDGEPMKQFVGVTKSRNLISAIKAAQ